MRPSLIAILSTPRAVDSGDRERVWLKLAALYPMVSCQWNSLGSFLEALTQWAEMWDISRAAGDTGTLWSLCFRQPGEKPWSSQDNRAIRTPGVPGPIQCTKHFRPWPVLGLWGWSERVKLAGVSPKSIRAQLCLQGFIQELSSAAFLAFTALTHPVCYFSWRRNLDESSAEHFRQALLWDRAVCRAGLGCRDISHQSGVSISHSSLLAAIYSSNAVLWHFRGLPGTATKARHWNPPFVLLTSAVQVPIPLNSKPKFQSGWLNWIVIGDEWVGSGR